MNLMSAAGRDLLRRRIELSGYPIAYVSEQLGHDRTWLTKILNGSRQITFDHVEAVLKFLDVPITHFLADLAHEAGPAPDSTLIGPQRPSLLLKGSPSNG